MLSEAIPAEPSSIPGLGPPWPIACRQANQLQDQVVLHACTELADLSAAAGEPSAGLPPLRSLGNESMWAVLTPKNFLDVPGLRHRRQGRKSLVLQPSFGGRRRKQKQEHSYTLPPDPTVFRMGNGPRALGFYHRPEHLRCNRTKNSQPLRRKRRPGKNFMLHCRCCVT